jgi:hypothetical protein
MLLAEELDNLTDKFKANASLKELAFFKYLASDPLPYPDDTDLSDQEQVFLAAFCSESPVKRELVEKLSGTQPIRGIHYSNNLIELAAFATFDLDKEIDHLKSYAANHSIRDYFILDKLFPNVLSYPPQPNNAVDQLAFDLLAKSISPESKLNIVEAINSAEDLLDVYVISEAYFYLLDFQPATQYRKDLSVLLGELTKVIKRVDMVLHIALTIGIGYLLFRLYVWLIPLIYHYWDKAEPVMAIIDLVLGGVGFLLLFFIGTQPDRLKLLKSLERGIGTVVLRIAGINRNRVEQKIEEYVSQPASMITEREHKLLANESTKHVKEL